MFAGARRWVWNELLSQWEEKYEKIEESPSKKEQDQYIRDLKYSDVSWLKRIPAQLPQQVIRDLHKAFEKFFNGEAEHPKYKSKKDIEQTFRIPQGLKVDNRQLYIPKIGWIGFFKSQEIEGEIKSATIKKEPHGWFISINVILEKEVEFPDNIDEKDCVGVDLGLNNFAVLSTGEKVSHGQWYKKHEKKLGKAQRKLTRKEYGSNNWQDQRERVSRIHRKIKRCRMDFLHKLSSRIVSENQAVFVEDLNVEGMKQSHLGKSIGHSGWSEFIRLLEYKCQREGIYFAKVGRFEPTSKECRHCGATNDIDLSDRSFSCRVCGESLDRDVNAAKNIKQKGLKILAGGQSDSENASGEVTSGSVKADAVEVVSSNEELGEVVNPV